MITFHQYLNERDDIFFKSYTAAIDHALTLIPKDLRYDEDDFFTRVTTGPRKPSEGKTVRWKLPLYKGDKLVKYLVASVYNRGGDSAPFELTAYVS